MVEIIDFAKAKAFLNQNQKQEKKQKVKAKRHLSSEEIQKEVDEILADYEPSNFDAEQFILRPHNVWQRLGISN